MTTSKVFRYETIDGNVEEVWFERGEFFVVAQDVEDPLLKTRAVRAFSVYHRPTMTRAATTSILAAAIKGCVYLDQQLREVLDDPDKDDETPAFGQGGFAGFGV